jgi:membrane-bound hydrogenase subunit beta
MAEKKTKQLDAEGIVKFFKDEFKTKVKSSKIEKRTAGIKKNEYYHIWMKIDKSVFKDFIKKLCDHNYPHLAVVSGNDLGKDIELIYHFSLYFGKKNNEISLNLSVDLPKNKPEIETICDFIPGALITEREKQEMLGVKVIGIPDERRLFLSDDWPEGVYPWRKDEKGMDEYIRNLHENDKTGGKK